MMDKIAVIGGSKKFCDFLSLTKANIDFDVTIEKAINEKSYSALIMLPFYEKGEETIPQLTLEEIEVLAKRKREGFRVYSENYDSFNTYNKSVFCCEVTGKICHINNESLCAYNGLQNIIGDGRIMQASGASYLPAIVRLGDPYVLDKGVLLQKGHYVGTSQISPLNVNDIQPVLLKTGSFYVSLLSISNLDYVNFRPNSRWKKIFVHIFSYILNAEKDIVKDAFEKTFPPLKTVMSPDSEIDSKDWENILKLALENAVKWHIDSGVVLGDGTGGAVEMIMSNNGQKLYTNRRTDAGLYTGWLLYAAGKYFNNSEWLTKGKNVFDYFVNRTQLSGGILDGLFTWYYNEDAGPHDIYSIDCGRDGIALCNMYKLTGDKELLKRIKRLADGFSNWMDGDLLASFYLSYVEDMEKNTHSKGENVLTPGVYGEMVSFMAMASEILGDEKYLDIVIKIADKLVSRYPDFDYHGHTTSARNARFLLLLLCIQKTGKRDYSEIINTLIDYLASIQLSCGAIYCEDNITFERNIDANCESGIIAPWDNDKISDQLYVVNNSLVALSVLKSLPDSTKVNKQKGLKMFDSLLKYTAKIQITSDDKRFNGGWMRAYSVTHKEYYGLDLDKFWGSYCIMAGWTMGIIPLAMLTELTGECPYVI